ncbi:MAG: branched-chain amino acid ABC transporter permease, partial [Betaproteobacteria bacterium]
MSAQFLQFLLAGLTIGAIYALVALGFSIIYNASQVINFAQGEFVMIGGMATVSLTAIGWPLPFAIAAAVLAAAAVGLALEKLAVEPARGASVVTLIIITIGASILLRGLATLVWDKNIHALSPFSGDTPIQLGGATLVPQSLWVMGITLAILLLLTWFF